jgi:hypothetical protein
MLIHGNMFPGSNQDSNIYWPFSDHPNKSLDNYKKIRKVQFFPHLLKFTARKHFGFSSTRV